MLVCGLGPWLFVCLLSRGLTLVLPWLLNLWVTAKSPFKLALELQGCGFLLLLALVCWCGVHWWCFPSDGRQATEMNQNSWGFFACLECQLIVASTLLSKCGIYLLLKLGIWLNWKPQTKHLEAKLKPCFIPQHLGEVVQIEKIKELFSDHMVLHVHLSSCALK